MAKSLRKIGKGKIKVFKIENRRGYAAVCLNNLTEGRSVDQALRRMARPLKRQGYLLEV